MTTPIKTVCAWGEDMFNKNDPTKGAQLESWGQSFIKSATLLVPANGESPASLAPRRFLVPLGYSEELFTCNNTEDTFKQLHKQIFIHVTV